MREKESVLQAWLEYVGGASDTPPRGWPGLFNSPLFWASWWTVLLLAILAFSGQTSKFIYIDF